MSKVKYYYDPETLSYRPIGVTNKNRISNFVLFILSSFLLGLFSLLILLNSDWINTPAEMAQKRLIQNYELQFDILNKKLTQIESVVDNIEERDNNLYRVYFEASPIPELASDDNDFERQWIRLGAVGAELRVKSIVLSDDHVAPSSKIDITTEVLNKGGETLAAFKVAFFAGDSETPFKVMTITGIGSGETREVTTTWRAEDVSYVRVEVDYGNLIPEVNDDDNTATHSVDIAYAKYLGGLDSIRENPLQWIFAIVSILVVISVVSIASRTSIDYGEGVFDEEDSDWEDDEDEYDDEDEDEDTE